MRSIRSAIFKFQAKDAVTASMLMNIVMIKKPSCDFTKYRNTFICTIPTLFTHVIPSLQNIILVPGAKSTKYSVFVLDSQNKHKNTVKITDFFKPYISLNLHGVTSSFTNKSDLQSIL